MRGTTTCRVKRPEGPAQTGEVTQATAVTDLLNEMRKAGDEVSDGSTERLERMLVSQALVLDEIFNNLAQRSHLAEYIKNLEIYLRLALKAEAGATPL